MRKIVTRVFVCALAALAIWIAVDMYRPYKVDIRTFDADEVARLDTAMWRSYYSRERVGLYRGLNALLDEQFHFPFWRRQMVAYYAARSAFVFKDGRSRDDYERALPDLEKFYGEIRSISTTDFDAPEASRLELEWWIVHRQRTEHQSGDLARALAVSAAAVYGVTPDSLAEYGDARAAAMDIRDSKAEAGGVTEADWQEIDRLLHQGWVSLHTAVNKK